MELNIYSWQKKLRKSSAELPTRWACTMTVYCWTGVDNKKYILNDGAMTLSLSSSMDDRIFRDFYDATRHERPSFYQVFFLLWWQKNLSKYLVKSPKTSLKMIFFRIKSLLRSNSQILISSSSRGCPNTHLVLTHFFHRRFQWRREKNILTMS